MHLFQGDSGGALVCLDKFGRWTQEAVFVFAPTGCNVVERPSVFTATEPMLSWIKETGILILIFTYYHHDDCHQKS